MEYKVKRFSLKTKVLKSLVKGAKGQGNKVENAVSGVIVKAGKGLKKFKEIGTPVGPSVGEVVNNGVSKAAGFTIKNPTTAATQVVSKAAIPAALEMAAPGSSSYYLASPVGPGTILTPSALKADQKLRTRFPRLQKVGDKVASFPQTRVGRKVTSIMDGAYGALQLAV